MERPQSSNNVKNTTAPSGKQPSQPASQPSSQIATAFGTRRTRSTTGNLPPGSINQLRRSRQRQPTTREEVVTTEQSEVPEPEQPEQINEPTVRDICSNMNQPISDRVNQINDHVSSLLNTQELNNGNQQTNFQQLREDLEAIKVTLNQQEAINQQSELALDVQKIRTDLNQILEERSTINQPNQQKDEVHNYADEPADQQSQHSETDDEKEVNERLLQRIRTLENERDRPKRSQVQRSHKSNFSKYHGSRSRRQYSDSSSSSNGSYRPNRYGPSGRNNITSESEDGSEEDVGKISFYQREKGARYPGLYTIKPADPTFDRLLNYRYYRLQRTRVTRSSERTLEVKKHIKSLDLSLRKKFTGKDPVMILNFLTRFVEEADIIKMTEAQALLALPHYLMDSAETQFRASIKGARSGGITSFPEAIQYLLRTYATPSALREAVNAVRDIRQQANETENEYNIRLSNACDRCGNAFDEAQKMTFFVNGLMESIRSIVARFRESIPRSELSYTELVSYAQDEGDAHRARFSGLRVLRSSKHSPPPRRSASSRHANILDVATTSSNYNGDGQEEDIFILPEDSVPTSDLPTTVRSSSQETSNQQLLFTGNFNRTPARPIAYGDRSTTPNRVGWTDRQPAQRLRIICYQCYSPDHTSPNCNAKISDISSVVNNYEALNASEKERVPINAYKAAKNYVDAIEAAKLTNDINKEVGEINTSQSKN